MSTGIKNIIRSQVYQLVRSRSLRAVVLGLLALSVFFGASDKISEGKGTTACTYFVQMFPMTMSMCMFGIATVTGITCADDFTDKTSNNELMSGRLRSESYIARTIVSVVGSVLVGLAMVLALLATCFLVYPRGYELTNAALLQRVLLVIPVFIRFSCLFVFVSYVVKRPIAVVGVCYALMILVNMLSITGNDGGYLTAMGTFGMVCGFKSWYTYGLNTEVHYVYDSFMKSSEAAGIVIVSLAAGAVYLLLGYSYFHRDDIQ